MTNIKPITRKANKKINQSGLEATICSSCQACRETRVRQATFVLGFVSDWKKTGLFAVIG